MNKIVLVLLIFMIFLFTGCGGVAVPEEGEMKVGYSNGGGDAKDFAGFLAFTISDSSLDIGESANILFEYGHDFHQEEYYQYDFPFTVVVYLVDLDVSEYQGEEDYIYLYEETIDDFAIDDYKVEVNRRNILDVPEFSKTIELALSSEDFPFENGKLYYQLSYEIKEHPELERMVYKSIYFTNYEGILTFRKDRPD